jgi:hypothetical protein
MEAELINISRDLVAALERAILELSLNVESEHRFRFVSFRQSAPFVSAYAEWVKGGESGVQPVASTAEMRAAVYDQAQSASELRAFPKVVSVAGIELAEAALAGLKAGQIIVTYTALRGFIERTAHATAVASAVSKIKKAPDDGPLTPVLELGDVIHRSLYATRREWSKLMTADFRKTSVKDVQYIKKKNIASALPDNILNSIDKLDKAIPGTRLSYEILCEYLHPNVGDLWGATLEGTSSVDAHGTRHLVRKIGLGPKSFRGLPEHQSWNAKLFEICADIVSQMSRTVDELNSIAEKATRLTRRFAHSVVKKHRDQFLHSDPCPCLSGKTVAACTGLR